MKLVTADQMREMDRQAIENYGVIGRVLMENAGRGAAQLLHQRYFSLYPGPLLILCGKGNNGGDGYVMARHLQLWGWQVQVLVLAARSALTGDAAANLDILINSGHAVFFATDSGELDAVLKALPPFRCLVDGLFGNGMNAPARGHYLEAIRWMNRQSVPVAAIDMPSGIDATRGVVLGEAVQADCSFSFAYAKIGQVSSPACHWGGVLEIVDIGMPATLMAQVEDELALVEQEEARVLWPQRVADSHKGHCGHALIAAGSSGKGGAALMCAEACVAAGSGLTTLVTPSAVQAQLVGQIAEVMSESCGEQWGEGSEQVEKLIAESQGKSVLALGPGLGQGEGVRELVARLASACSGPLVIDADGLNALAGQCEILLSRSPATTVVTPHPGEMARLTGMTVEQIQADRVQVALDFSRRYQLVVLLKGARTVIAEPSGRVRINSSGNPGMASGGMGDVLTGVIAALVAQGLSLFDAATLGAYLHGRAADLCARAIGPAGYTARQVTRNLPRVIAELQP
ncbi:MAG: NAD(P)H-hydrate dehydratase [Desulfuromonadaceae bacterium]|nr:NAD(P)H-hydrate dehydratase [Desulfuromonadaceae bacterium]